MVSLPAEPSGTLIFTSCPSDCQVARENALASKIKRHGLKAFAVDDALFAQIIRFHFFHWFISPFSIRSQHTPRPVSGPIKAKVTTDAPKQTKAKTSRLGPFVVRQSGITFASAE